jgi:putative endopeptidase
MKITYKNSLLCASVSMLLVMVSCKNEQQNEAVIIPGIVVENMDNTVLPNDDFYKYVNGNWLENTEIPEDRSSWGSFYELYIKTSEDALVILNEAIEAEKSKVLKDAEVNFKNVSDQTKAVYLYESIMDTVKRNEQGLAPIKPYLAKIDEIKNVNDLQKFLIESEPLGGGGYFGFSVGTDLKDSNMNIAYLGAAGLGLIRDYYVDQDNDTKLKREKYVAHIAKMLQFFGGSDADAMENAKKIVAYETKLAEPRMTKEDSRDDRKRYNPTSIEELSKMTPSIDWKGYFKGIGVQGLDTIIVSELNYMRALEDVFTSNSIDDAKLYLKWTAIDRAAAKLSTDLEDTNWEFYSKTLRGAKKQRPRDESALGTLNSTIGEALGKLYVEKKFPPEAKAKAEKMIGNVMKAYEGRINNLDWMTPETKVKAIEKLNKMTVKIGYPDKWKDYTNLEVIGVDQNGSYFTNMQSVSKWNFQEDLDKLGKPVDKSEWYLAPQVVNAYFNPVNNEIVFPAAILQPPFYNYQADEAINYGGIGAVIGHEISHSFDDSGSRYDADGNLNNWWTDEDLENFTALGDKLVEQYNGVEVLPELFINGKFTLGENIGDLGGVNAAYDGLQIYLSENGRPDDIDGFTAEQRFYISWATIWRSKIREEALRNQIKSDSHSPDQFRGFMPLQNVDSFYEAFEIVEGDNMYLTPEERVKIW